MFLSLCHPYVSQSRWRLVFLTPEKYSNSQISVKDWIDIRYRIEWKNLLSSCKLLRNENYVNVEDSFIHVFFLFGDLFPVHVQGSESCRSHSKRFQFRQAVVQQSRRENIVAYLLLWSAIQRLAGARSQLYHVRLLLSKQHVSAFSRCTDYAFFFGVHCHVPCLCFILLSWPFCLLVFSASFLSFQFLLLLFSVLFSWLFITFLGVSWRYLKEMHCAT